MLGRRLRWVGVGPERLRLRCAVEDGDGEHRLTASIMEPSAMAQARRLREVRGVSRAAGHGGGARRWRRLTARNRCHVPLTIH
jgi:hypothetical protein